jgi:hypothetical protein
VAYKTLTTTSLSIKSELSISLAQEESYVQRASWYSNFGSLCISKIIYCHVLGDVTIDGVWIGYWVY